jgi:spore coat polysaccharide biosynthesis protein SpsF
MNLRPGIILQARHASTRLPGKALQSIGGRTLLSHCIRRLLAAGVGRVALATTDRPDDDPLAEIATQAGLLVFRGSEHDVLGRFSAAAERFQMDPVLRATGDNPAVDPAAPARLLKALAASGADYAMEVGLPLGGGLEAMRGAALHYAASAATSSYDREHVTTFIKRHPETFTLLTLQAPAYLCDPSLGLTVDTQDDLNRVRSLFAACGREEPSLESLIATARTRAWEAA